MSVDSLVIDTEDWQGSDVCTIGDLGFGVLGSEIAATGDNGPGYAYNDLSLPADANKEVCGQITTWPSAGTLFAYEDTSFTFSGAPDGTYTFQYQLYVDGVATGSPATVTLTVGGSALAASASSSANASASLTTAIRLSASALAVANVTATLASGAALSSSASARATAAADLTTGIRLAANAVARALATADLTANTSSFVAAAVSQALANADLTTQIALSAAAVARATSAVNVVTWTDSPEGYTVPAELMGYSVEEGPMSIETFEKQPVDVEDIDVSYTDWLARRGDSIASVDVTADPGITLPPHQISDGVVKVWHAGGTDEERYKVTITVTTVGGRVKQTEHYMKVKDY
jgi:hypothetical protein